MNEISYKFYATMFALPQPIETDIETFQFVGLRQVTLIESLEMAREINLQYV